MRKGDILNLKLMPGDVVLFQAPNFIGKAIRFFERSKGEEKSIINHVGIIPDVGTVLLLYAKVLHAVERVKIESLLDYCVKSRSKIAIYRGILTGSANTGEYARVHYLGKKYGYVKILAHMLDYAIGGKYFFRKLAGSQNYPICSWVVAYAYDKACGYRFKGVPPMYSQPDDIADDVMCESYDWACILPLIDISRLKWD